MKTTNRFLLAASFALALVFTLNACSSDDSGNDGTTPSSSSGGGSFGSCEEAMSAFGTCLAELKNSNEYKACGSDEDCQDGLIFSTQMETCAMNTGVCGDASYMKCIEHFDNECPNF